MKNRKRIGGALLCFLWSAALSFAQDETALPRGFRGLSLGMDMESLKTALGADAEFSFRGDADVSLLPLRRQRVVDTQGAGYIKRAFFQTSGAQDSGEGDAVFIMAFVLNTEKIDHYSVFTQFTQKYGDPVLLNPRLALWEDGATRIYIERPLTVKYIDKVSFDALAAEAKALESAGAKLRTEFLDAF